MIALCPGPNALAKDIHRDGQQRNANRQAAPRGEENSRAVVGEVVVEHECQAEGERTLHQLVLCLVSIILQGTATGCGWRKRTGEEGRSYHCDTKDFTWFVRADVVGVGHNPSAANPDGEVEYGEKHTTHVQRQAVVDSLAQSKRADNHGNQKGHHDDQTEFGFENPPVSLRHELANVITQPSADEGPKDRTNKRSHAHEIPDANCRQAVRRRRKDLGGYRSLNDHPGEHDRVGETAPNHNWVKEGLDGRDTQPKDPALVSDLKGAQS